MRYRQPQLSKIGILQDTLIRTTESEQTLINAYKREGVLTPAGAWQLVPNARIDDKSASESAEGPRMSISWGTKCTKLRADGSIDGQWGHLRTGRPASVPRGIMRRVRRRARKAKRC